ncbi:unnamed protein product [Ectocarpus sp. 12 AP-2014]
MGVACIHYMDSHGRACCSGQYRRVDETASSTETIVHTHVSKQRRFHPSATQARLCRMLQDPLTLFVRIADNLTELRTLFCAVNAVSRTNTPALTAPAKGNARV